jgi:tetratricopeptide (TPR) repeat protein
MGGFCWTGGRGVFTIRRMVHFLFSVIALPVRLVAHGAAMWRLFNPRPLLWIAWQLAHDPQDAVGVISLTAGQFGMGTASEMAEQMFAQVLDCQIYTTLAWIEIAQNNNLSAAERWLQIADGQGVLNRHLLYAVKLFLSDHGRAYDKAAIIDEMLGRNDLPGEYTRDAMLGKAAILLKQKNWTQAEQIANHILKVEDNPHAVWIKWVVAAANNKNDEAGRLLQELLTKGASGQMYCMVALGWQYIGNRREAMLALHEAEKYNVNIDLFDRELGELTKTAEYYILKESEEGKK